MLPVSTLPSERDQAFFRAEKIKIQQYFFWNTSRLGMKSLFLPEGLLAL